ncbi:MAG: TIGR02757 family protein [Cyclobacteriaceae bacterium]|nr:TIGR02757 family protein [Cyclobacteriaceae bacterium]
MRVFAQKKKKSSTRTPAALKELLDEKVAQYNQPGFIEHDPVQIPHQYTKQQDIEIAALFAATLAWGQRITIINNCKRLLGWMDNDPHAFVLNHRERDLKPFLDFRHRTFNATDTLYFIEFLRWFYTHHHSLEEAFKVDPEEATIEKGLIRFRNLFFSLPDYPQRTKKHVATPERKSACKRLTMFLRWMVRQDNNGVDFGLWQSISPAQLISPCDVHVDRVARKLKLVTRKQTDWLTAVELTNTLRKFDNNDPVKYDFALFGLGLEKF